MSVSTQAQNQPLLAPRSARAEQLSGWARHARAYARLTSGLILMFFVLCHLLSHIFLLVSLPIADKVLDAMMWFWRSDAGSIVLASTVVVHVSNALWSLYIRRYLRMPAWEIAQLAMGLLIPPLVIIHIVGTKVSDKFFGTATNYPAVLAAHWLSPPYLGVPWLVALQFLALLTVWIHACIGLHFWLRIRQWYPAWMPILGTVAVLIPALSLAGFIAGGNYIWREAEDPDFIANVVRDAKFTEEASAGAWRWVRYSFLAYGGLVLLPFAGRFVRGFVRRVNRPPRLTFVDGRKMTIVPGATVLETLRANNVPLAAVCGGRARCTTCRIRVVNGLELLPKPVGLEAAALTRIAAPAGVRLACQLRPTASIGVVPLLTPDASATHGLMRAGMEGAERQITVMFIDLRGSTTLSETRLPYDVLFILNQFFDEMSTALAATGGHYSNFTGDGLMAIYGLYAPERTNCSVQAMRGAREMLSRLDKVNARLKADLKEPLRIGIGIHFGEAIVGAMGPPKSQIVTAIGDTVNTTARLEGLTKEYNCSLIVSQAAAQAAGLKLDGHELHTATVKGRVGSIGFYALNEAPDLPS